MIPTKDVFIYSDYRLFLRDFYLSRKKSSKVFTFANIAELAGFSSPSFVKHIIDGKRNLTRESAAGFARALHLNKAAATYFEAMVFFNQSQLLHEKLEHLTIMDRYRPKNIPHVLSTEQYRYLEKWYHPVIRELVDLPGFIESPEQIAQTFLTPLHAEEVQKALYFLEQSGYLTRDNKGTLTRKTPTLAVFAEDHASVMATSIRRFHLAMLKMAERAIEEIPVNSRTVGNLTLSLSAESYETAIKRIEQMRHELLEIAKVDSSANRVYQLTFTLFPLTKDASVDQKKGKNNAGINE